MKKLLLGLGSIASVVAPMAAVISCGDDDKNTNTDAHVSAPVALDQTTAGTVNTNFAGFGMQAADIAKTEKSSSFTFGASHPVTYDKVVIITLAAKTGGYSMTIGGETFSSTMAVEAGDKVIFAAKTTTRRATAGPTVAAFFVPKDTDRPTLDLSLGDAAQEAVAKKILMPVYPELAEGAGSGSTGGTGTTPTHTTTNFTAPHALSATWHPVFKDGTPALGDIFEATVNTQTLSHTLVQADLDALTAATTQEAKADKVAELIASEDVAITKAQVLATFGLPANGSGNHTWMPASTGGTGTGGSTGGTGTGTTTTDLQTELDKFADAVSDKTVMELIIILGSYTTATTSQLGIPDVSLATGVTATLTISKGYTSGPLAVTVTLAKTGAASVTNNTKTITVTPKVGQSAITVDLGASTGTSFHGGKITKAAVLGAIARHADYGTSTTSITIRIDSHDVVFSINAGANDAAIETAMVRAITADLSMTNCFDNR